MLYGSAVVNNMVNRKLIFDLGFIHRSNVSVLAKCLHSVPFFSDLLVDGPTIRQRFSYMTIVVLHDARVLVAARGPPCGRPPPAVCRL